MTFYERVKQEYLSSYEVFLCDGSETFRNNWLSFPIIKVHAEKFLIEKNLNDLLIGGCILFIVRDYLTTKLSPKQIRLDFLNWCIDNGLHIAEGGEYEAQNIKLKQMYNRSTTVYFSTKPPLLAICCYVMCFLKS